MFVQFLNLHDLFNYTILNFWHTNKINVTCAHICTCRTTADIICLTYHPLGPYGPLASLQPKITTWITSTTPFCSIANLIVQHLTSS